MGKRDRGRGDGGDPRVYGWTLLIEIIKTLAKPVAHKIMLDKVNANERYKSVPPRRNQ